MRLNARDADEQAADHHVIVAVLQGETAAFEILIRRYGERAFRAARGLAGNDEEAEKVVEEAFVTAFTQLRQFNDRACFGRWVTRIAIDESAARRRRDQSRLEGSHATDRIRHPRGAARQRRQPA